MNLSELIKYNDFNKVYLIFKKQIDLLSINFNIEIYKNDIFLFLWNLTKKINTNNFKSEKALYGYIYISLKRYCISIHNKNKHDNVIIYDSNITNIEIEKLKYSQSLNTSSLIFDDLISHLPNKQKKIINMRYKQCLSDSEIASILNISRQAVHKNRCSALNKLHNII